jgi:hypothetical protein
MNDAMLAAEAIDDPSIPVLTERIFLPPVDFDTSIPEAAATDRPPDSVDAAAAAAVTPPEVEPSAPIGPEEPTETVEGPAATAELAVAEALSPGVPAAAPLETEPAGQPPPDAAAAIATEQTPEAASEAAADEVRAEALRAAVLARVAEKLPGQVETTIRELLQPSIDRAVSQLNDEAQMALRIALQELVEQAVREEMSRPRAGDARR